MNILQDPSKKTSITSLLNPQDGYSALIAPAPVVPNHGQSQAHPYDSGYAQPSSFNLRAASWENHDESTRKVVNGQPVHHQYHQQLTHPTMLAHPTSNDYPYSPRMSRPRMDDAQGYSEREPVWQPPPQQHQQPESSNMSYGHVQSNERTALAGDYSNQNNYTSGYQNQPESSVWQTSYRASVRIAAKGTVSETTHDQRYAQPSYYDHHQNIYASLQSYPPQQQQITVAPSAQLHAESMRHSGSSSSSSSKRHLPESDVTPAPKAKRPKAKAKLTGADTPSTTTTPGTSKRGYNAKKRSEAAFISAQNADALQRAQREKGSEGYRSQPDSEQDRHPSTMTDSNGSSVSFIPELQFARCMSNRYKKEEFPRCVSCTRRWAGDTCRFQGIRYFMRDAHRRLTGVSFTEHHSLQAGQMSAMEFPTKWNRKFEKEHIRRIKLSIAKDLLPTLLTEQEHLKVDEIVRRPRECDVRATCDTCMTSLFSTSFMCRLCGREVCNECFQQVRALTHRPANATQVELNMLAAKREKSSVANPFFLSCTKRNEHGIDEFTPVTRFVDAELNKAVKEMGQILDEEARKESHTDEALAPPERSLGDSGSSVPDVSSAIANNDPKQPGPQDATHDTSSLTEQRQLHLNPTPPSPNHSSESSKGSDSANEFPDPITSPIYDDYTPSNAPAHATAIPIHRLQIIPASLYDQPSSPSTNIPSRVFSSLWRKGRPLLVKGILPRFKIKWNPRYFMEHYGDQTCLVVECQTDLNKRVSIREFFGWFGAYGGRNECWKLKDWPPTADFKNTFPELYEDFSRAVPVPDYVRRDGVYNIGSHFPTNAVGPDLGPKMYNSMASSQEPGSKGSTRLHMDMADALNVMLHAEPCADGTEGYAIWDLFRAEDSDKIRAFLKKKFGYLHASNSANGQPSSSAGGNSKSAAPPAPPQVQMIGHDPIHGQQFYLDVELRKALWEECGVKSYRVYQRPGDGVFIPAGCAHQVANMSDCIKIATDFVSPENIDRCEKLTKEFREQNQSKVWKEDVLQLRTMMWFAWQSCSMMEEELAKEEAAAANSAKADADENTNRENDGGASGGDPGR